MAQTAKEAGVQIVAGDTKVVEGNGGLFINTAGVGLFPEDREQTEICAAGAKAGDCILVSGNLGDHHAAILSQRMGIKNGIQSDCAPLGEIVEVLLQKNLPVHTLRDVTRGGLASVLKELAEASQKAFVLKQDDLPVTKEVQDFCGLLGLDPLYMGNEGKLVAFVPKEYEAEALEAMRSAKYGQDATVIGYVEEAPKGEVLLHTSIGGVRSLDVLMGEGLPRIC